MDLFGIDDFLPYSNTLLSQKAKELSQQSFHHHDDHDNHHYHHHCHCLQRQQYKQQQRQQQQYHRHDIRQSKPQPSYIGLIAMAILSSTEQKMVLSEVYQWIIDNYPYFRTRGVGWRN
ncbi:unnamed protein product, partial [Acanthocheilonema viteae]